MKAQYSNRKNNQNISGTIDEIDLSGTPSKSTAAKNDNHQYENHVKSRDQEDQLIDLLDVYEAEIADSLRKLDESLI